MTPLLDLLRRRLWTIALGMALAGGLWSWRGPGAVVGVLLLLVATAVIVRFVAPPSQFPAPRMPTSEEPMVAILSPMVRKMLAQMPVPVMLLDESAKILFLNESMRSVVGSSVEEKPVSAVLRNPEILNGVAQTMADGEPAAAQFTLPVPIERYYEAYCARVNVAPSVVVLMLHDLTATRRIEQMRKDFVANASHELRTPLAAVSGFIDTLRGHAKDDEAAREAFLEIMSAQTARMRRLIDDLLSLTRIELNEHMPPSGRVSLERVVREAVEALEPLSSADRITVTIAAAANLPQVIGDRDELIQLFQNLVHNAIKYGREGGHVWIKLDMSTEGDGQLHASVADDGEGIPATAVPRLTERFYRVDVKRS
ncbi:MAG TPA: histidine kinase dimerization/phospho-acceptor domain-containing protein, partial [Rhizomicrobium sp.]|nr:histidine kinase dimerization/phospho-acceptor domain-containing protein [Rhizomicrobium sp.]